MRRQVATVLASSVAIIACGDPSALQSVTITISPSLSTVAAKLPDSVLCHRKGFGGLGGNMAYIGRRNRPNRTLYCSRDYGPVLVLATSSADSTKVATAQVKVTPAVQRDISNQYADKFEVITDPYAINPLAAVVNIRDLAASDVNSVKVHVKDDGAEPGFASSYAPNSEAYRDNWDSSDVLFAKDGLHVPVIGLLADVDNQVDIVIETRHNEQLVKTLTITTRLANDLMDHSGIVTLRSGYLRLMPTAWSRVGLWSS